ncbi:MAG: UDP-N-acetylmuramoyl-L-alanyl-D-glutamate--2,6-diaminopimelate ligase, partial [Angelakisella sp.]
SAYAIICANHFDNPSRKLKLLGVTGTNGKTTITYLLKSILAAAGKKTGLMGTIHNEILDMVLPAKYTTPDPYQLHAMLSRMAEAGCEYVVMEASSHALDQHRLDGCEFDVAVFTNLTQDHLDYHGTMENYFLAKRKLFDHCRRAVINIDDSYGVRLAEELGKRAVTCSLQSDMATFTAKNIECEAAGSKFVLVADSLIERVKVPMPGMFSVMNAMEAAVAAIMAEISPRDAASGLAECYGVTGRAEVIPTPNRDFTIIRDYAHTPDGLEKIIGALRPFIKGRLVTLFGCAGNRDRTKRPMMAEYVAAGSDFVILTSDNPRDEDPMQIINDAKPGLDSHKTPYKIIPDRYTAILWAIDNLQTGDLLLLAGKGHEDYQVLHDETIYFDEKALVEKILSED